MAVEPIGSDDLLEWPDDVDSLLRRYVAANEAVFVWPQVGEGAGDGRPRRESPLE